MRGQSDGGFSLRWLAFSCPHRFVYLPIMRADEKLSITTSIRSNTTTIR
jgi:hypothetical protein